MDPKKHIYIVDGNAYIHRAYHAISPLSNKQGLPTHATYGFTNILTRILREKNPQYLAIAFDSKGPNFRHEIYSDYKANRPPMAEDLAVQIPYIKEIVKAHNILSLEISGVEADDIIASMTEQLARKGHQITIVSGDKDLLQLVSERVVMWEPMNNKLLDQAAIFKKYKVMPEKLTDLFSLIGDSSDNIPGVPGIGPKTAEKLITEFGSLDKLFESCQDIKRVKLRDNLISHKHDALLSRDLIRMKTDLKVPDSSDSYKLSDPDLERLTELYTDLDFSKLLRETKPVKSFDTSSFKQISTEKQFNILAEKLSNAEFLAVDTETTSLDTITAELVGISLSFSPKSAYYLPISHCDTHGQLLEGQIEKERVIELLKPYLEDPKLPKIGHNLKYDFSVLQNYGLNLTGPLWDTMIASYLLDPARRSYKLDTLCQEHGYKMTSFEEVTDNATGDDCFRFVPLEEAKNYSCEDVAAVILLWEEFKPLLKSKNLMNLFTDIETPLVPVLALMERNGIQVDTALLKELSIEFDAKLKELDKKIFLQAGREFKITSPKQLAEILFDELHLPHGRKTKTGYSTDNKVLEKLSQKHELPKLIIEHRNLTKLQTTYVNKLAPMIHPQTNRIHSSFNQTVTATGRLSSSKPNLQNIPIRTAEGQRIREAFIPEQGHIFVAADYSQIDLRVLAHYSKDPALVEAFCNGEDVHQQTAAQIFRINPSFVTGQMRRVAKSINFGIIYGMSAFGLAGQLNISRKDAATFIERYLAHYHGVKQFMDDIIQQAQNDGFVTTLLGRRRQLPDINSPNKTRREFAERTALNTPIQGTAADIIKLASLETVKQLSQNNLSAKLILQIHDELVLETPVSEKEQTCSMIKTAMESAYSLHVPLIANVTTGHNLAKT